MPLIEVYARWRDENDKEQKQFISSVSSPEGGLTPRTTHTWLADAVKAAEHIERQNAIKPEPPAISREVPA